MVIGACQTYFIDISTKEGSFQQRKVVGIQFVIWSGGSWIKNNGANFFPNDQEIVRLVMAFVGRGGQGDVGQRIRDEILMIQRNNDCKSGMMEEWHQKLHNNSSLDDVFICEEKLASYDRPIVSEPHFRMEAKEGLIHDLTIDVQWALQTKAILDRLQLVLADRTLNFQNKIQPSAEYLVNELITVQRKVYRKPTVIIATRVTGEEEIPDGVVAVLTSDMPDVLSHICFATCFDQNNFRNLKLKEGRAVSIQLNDISGSNLSLSSLVSSSIPRRVTLQRKTFCGRYALSLEEFTTEMVGAKSCNIKFLRGRVPSWIRIPMSVAMPFGAFETVLSKDINKKAKLNHEDLRMAVLVQEVICGDYAFVIHTKNPLSGDTSEIYAEDYTLSRLSFFTLTQMVKILRDMQVPGFMTEESMVLDCSIDPMIVDKSFQISLFSKVAEAGKIIETLYGRPQDIEGVIKDGIVYVVQTRPQ
ncbi:hypothetical protein QQP08_022781, partial [Theobroma cacao]